MLEVDRFPRCLSTHIYIGFVGSLSFSREVFVPTALRSLIRGPARFREETQVDVSVDSGSSFVVERNWFRGCEYLTSRMKGVFEGSKVF